MEANVAIVGQAHRLPSGNWQPERLPYKNYLAGGEMTSHAQPARKQSPPSGVIAPNQRTFVNAITYKLPLNSKIPTKNNHHGARFADPKRASANSAIA